MINDEPNQHPDETNDFGRYRLRCKPTGDDELYAVIIALVERSCAVGNGDDLDSWAICAFERGIEVLAAAVDRRGRPSHKDGVVAGRCGHTRGVSHLCADCRCQR